jgi:uncharacterized protein YajQ (UPF0234 family)
MAADNSFDVVSKVDLQEVRNAMDQAIKEIRTRFEAVTEILQAKFVKRGISLKALDYGKIEPASGSSVRQKITLQQGIPGEKAKEIVKLIKESKKKVQASIQGDTVRITGKDRDTLQEAIALIKGHDFGIDMQFTNYRTN